MASRKDDDKVVDFIGGYLSITFEDMVWFIRSNYTPEDIFDSKDLGDWAEDNGFVKEG